MPTTDQCPECEAPTEATGEGSEYRLCPECGWDSSPWDTPEERTIPDPCASCGSTEIKAAEFVRRVWDATLDSEGILHLSGEETQLDVSEQWHLMCGNCEEPIPDEGVEVEYG